MSRRPDLSPLAVFGFRGRVDRLQFAVSAVYQVALTMALTAGLLVATGGGLADALAEGMADGGVPDLHGYYGAVAVAVAAQTLLSVLTFTSMRERLHDIGMSGWWTAPMSVPSLIAVVGAFGYGGVLGDVLQMAGTLATVVLVAPLFFVPGQPGPNAYGDPAREATPAAASAGRQAG